MIKKYSWQAGRYSLVKKAYVLFSSAVIAVSALMPSVTVMSARAVNMTSHLYPEPNELILVHDENNEYFSDDELNYQGFMYVESQSFIKITGYSGDETDIVIPDTISGRTVTEIEEHAFSETAITSVVIPETVRNAANAFDGCETLREAGFCDGIKSVPFGIFDGASALEEVFLPEGITALDGYCFEGTALSSIKLPDSLETIEEGVFNYSTSLSVIQLPEGLKSIGQNAFSGTGLTSVMIPASLTDAASAFTGCDSLTKAEIAEGMEIVPFGLFDGASALEEITIPEGVKTLGSYSFEGTALKRVQLPASIDTIENAVFQGSEKLSEIQMPNGLTSIGELAFAGTALFDVTIPGSVTEANNAFLGCDSLINAEITEGMETVPFGMFDGCSSLSTVILPESVKLIDKYAFENCPALSTISPASVSPKFYVSSFYGCYGLKDNRFTLFDMQDTYLCSNTNTMRRDGLAYFTLRYKLSDVAEECSEAIAHLTLTEGLELVEESFTFTDSDDVRKDFSVDDTWVNLHKYEEEESVPEAEVRMTGKEGVLRFAVRTEIRGTHKLSVELGLDYKEEKYKLFLSDSEIVSPDLTLDVSDSTNKLSVNVSGISSLDHDVEIYVDNVLANTITPNQFTGKYSANVELPEKPDGSVYSVFAKSGNIETESSSVFYSKKSVSLTKVLWTKDTAEPDDVIDLTGAFLVHEKPFHIIDPHKEMMYEVSFSDNSAIDRVYIVNSRPDNTYFMRAYYYEDTDSWFASGFFDCVNMINMPDDLDIVCFYKPGCEPECYEGNSAHTVSFRSAITSAESDGTICSFKDDNDKKLYTYKIAPGLTGFRSKGGERSIDPAAPDAEGLYFQKIGTDDNGLSLFMVLEDVKRESVEGAKNGVIGFLSSLGGETNNEIVKNAKTASAVSFNSLFNYVTGGVPGYDDMMRMYTFSGFGASYIERIAKSGNSPELLYMTEVALFLDSFETLGGGKAILMDLGLDPVLASLMDKFVVRKFVDKFVEELDAEIEIEEERKKSSGGSSPLGGGGYSDPISSSSGSPSGSSRPGSSSCRGYNPPGKRREAKKEFSDYVGDIIDGLGEAGYNIGSGVKNGLEHFENGTKKFGNTIASGGKKIAENFNSSFNIGVDPSGIVYEAVKGNPVSDADVRIYYQDSKSGEAILWNAEDYEQLNPLSSDKYGAYSWDVPEGMWKVVCSKDGYDSAESDWMSVLPVRTGVDLALVSHESPELKSVETVGNKVYVTFTKYMDITSVRTESLTVEGAEGYTVTPILHDEGDIYTDTFVITGLTSAKGVSVTADDTMKSYAGTLSTPGTLSSTTVYMLGDIDGDGTIDSTDASEILTEYAATQTSAEPSLDKSIADVNADGFVDSTDASSILSYYAFIMSGGVGSFPDFIASN